MASSGSIVGNISELSRQIHVEWEIPNYFSLPQKADYVYKSPEFSILNTNWCLNIHPNGQRLADNVGFVGVYLHMLAPNFNCNVNFMVSFKDSETMKKGPGICNFSEKDYTYGWIICERNHLRNILLRKGTLIISCEITLLQSAAVHANQISHHAASQTYFESTTSLCHDFEELLIGEQKTDAAIEVSGRSFRVHKVIMGARSSVFAAMFEHDMLEKKNGVVKIVDCNPDTFNDFLLFMYTGKMKRFSWENVIDLYELADKYCVQELKEICMVFMTEGLSLDTVCDIIAVVDRHQETELKKSAEKIIVDNIKTIVTTDKWKKLQLENSLLVIEILMKFIPGSSSV